MDVSDKLAKEDLDKYNKQVEEMLFKKSVSIEKMESLSQ